MRADLVSTALLGTARRPYAGDILDDVALEYAFDRGSVTTTTGSAPTPARDDDRLLLPDAAAARLVELLSARSALLFEWLAEAHRRNYRPPDRQVGMLMEAAAAYRDVREQLLRLAGPRGEWLARQNPAWQDLVRSDAEEVWRHGSAEQRRAWLHRLRERAPDAARDLLGATWDRETDRRGLLQVLATNLSEADVPFLDAALGDRRQDVRHRAQGLLDLLRQRTQAPEPKDWPHPWPVDDARRVVAEVVRTPRHKVTALLQLMHLHLPLELLPLIEQYAEQTPDPNWQSTFTAIAHTLRQRKQMLEELA